mgnify:CR=1 FL=1|tara:strand:- start:220 stop:675 length:456 start_codon:yes stop_codon:yes gene_type:complete
MDCRFNQKEKTIDCEIDGYWGTCGMAGNYSPYKYGIGKSVALITYEINKGSEQAGEQYEYFVCAECLQSEELDNDTDIDGHHLVKTQYIQGNTIHTVNEIVDKNKEKSWNYNKRHPMTRKMKKRIDYYYGVKHSDNWKKTYDDVFVKGIYD